MHSWADPEARARQAEEARLERRREVERLSALNASLVTGEWQVQVHIIEVRELKGEDLSGSCDPVVYVEALGQKQNTSIKEQTRSAVFDEILFFSFDGVGREELEDGDGLKVSIMDADTFTASDVIGCYQFDLLNVYFRPGHELYRQWVAVTDPTEADDSGTQGYLRLSVTVLGPGDQQVMHDPIAERLAEMEEERRAGANGGGMVDSLKVGIPMRTKCKGGEGKREKEREREIDRERERDRDRQQETCFTDIKA
jgi:hypothetical protein